MSGSKEPRGSPRLVKKKGRLSPLHGNDCKGREEDVEVMAERLQRLPHLLEYRLDDQKETPLISAVVNQHERCVQFLLSRGADVHATMVNKSVTLAYPIPIPVNALVLATSIGIKKLNEEVGKKIVRLLLKYGSNPETVIKNRRDISGMSTLFRTLIENNCKNYVELFLQCGADPNDATAMAELNVSGFVRNLQYAVMSRHHEIIELLLKYSAKINPDFASLIIYIAVDIGVTKCLKSLLIYNMIEETKINDGELSFTHMNFSRRGNCTLESELKSLRMYHKFGGKLTDQNFLEKPELQAELEKLRSAPLSLKELARVAILNAMGRRFPQLSDSLEIPASLHAFLKFPDVET